MDDKNNTGRWNTGSRNTGHWNTGHQNTGRWNTGHQNTGNRNTGSRNTGSRNTGHWNTGNRNTGFFNTETPATVRAFNTTDVNYEAFLAACPGWLFAPEPRTWVSEFEMTDAEKVAAPTFHTCGGYLRTNDMQTEWRKAFDAAIPEDRAKVRELPGFDAAVFLEITGLDLSETAACVSATPECVIVDGVRYVREQAA